MTVNRFSTASRPDAPATIVATDRLASRQWEAYLAAAEIAAGRTAWIGPTVLGYRAWTRELWSARRGDADPGLLTARQSGALWCRVIAESEDGSGLIGVPGAAEWAEDARRRVMSFRVDADRRRADPGQPDFAAFLRWHGVYRARLSDAGWIDEAELDSALTRSALDGRGAVGLADPLDLTPSQQTLLDALQAHGWSLTTHAAAPCGAPGAGPSAVRWRAADDGEELEAAAGWAARRIEADPAARVALVVPDLEARAAEVRGALLDALVSLPQAPGAEARTPVFVAADLDGSADARPLIGAALNAIELLSPRGSVAALSRWLRSPYFHADDPGSASVLARIEAELRLVVPANVSFAGAYRRGGLRDRLHAAPLAIGCLDAALAEIGRGEAVRSPSAWASLWPRLLQQLGFRGWQTAGTEQRRWEAALNDFALLTPIVGGLACADAVRELEASLARSAALPPVPLRGIHVFADVGDVGPGYSAAWVLGCTAARWPRPLRLNPFLPRRLQAEHGMPWSSPQDALQRSRELLGRLTARVPQCVFSWPARVGDEVNDASPLIRAFPELDGAGVSGRARRPAHAGGRRRETLEDPPPPLAEAAIEGGTAALDAQARCPLRAFCEHRLKARPLEPFSRGIPPRVKGLALHGALERLFRRFGSHAELAATPKAELREHIETCADAALAEAFGGRRRWGGVLRDLERERLTALVERFAAKELERAPFRVVAVERRESVELRGKRVETRIDRIDELADGKLAVIDYKSGRTVQARSWFKPRLADVQLPVYSIALGERLSAAVIATVRAEAVGYAGVWQSPEDFPGRTRKPPRGRTWTEQLDVWRDGVAALVDEIAGGDTRFFVADLEPAAGAFAPLTRVYEQESLYRGWLPPWDRA